MEEFIKIFTTKLCKKCNENYAYTVDENFIPNSEFIHLLVPTKRIDDTFFKNFMNDTEHGLFHGICCCYIAYLLNGKNFNESLSLSLIMHDFLKCNGFSQDMHDKELINYYNKLLPETYTHSNPEDDTRLLVKCDRIELMRYKDYKNWVDDRHYKIFDDIDSQTKEEIMKFYKEIRPSLLYFYENRDSIFLRHGLEKLSKMEASPIFPPPDSYMVIADSESYPIEIDRVPFGFDHMDVIRQHGYCSNHGLFNSWNKVKGFITLDDFIGCGGKIIDSKRRDHLYARSEIDMKEWHFLFQGVDEDCDYIKYLKDNNINIIEQKLLLRFFTLIKLLCDKILILNMVNNNSDEG